MKNNLEKPVKNESVSFKMKRRVYAARIVVSSLYVLALLVAALYIFFKHQDGPLGGVIAGALLSCALTVGLGITENARDKDSAKMVDNLYHELVNVIDSRSSCDCRHDPSELEKKLGQLSEDVRGVYAQVDTLRTSLQR